MSKRIAPDLCGHGSDGFSKESLGNGVRLHIWIDLLQPTLAKYMLRRSGLSSPGWQTFLRNPTAHIAAVDLFVVPIIGFKLLFGLAILRL